MAPLTYAEPFPGDDTPGIRGILKEVKGGCADHEKKIRKARELQDYYDGDSEKFIPYKTSEDSLSWLTRPKRISYITKQAIDTLTSHLYKPGPRARKVTSDPDVSAWYDRVARDINLSALMKKADGLATLHGLCAIGFYPTGDRARPVNYHLFPRQDFAFWATPDDPRRAVAVCTITKSGPKTTRYRLWTATHFYTFYKGQDWGYMPGGAAAARFDPESSGPHPYGCLPFAFVTHELPTTELEVCGIGEHLARINKTLNTDKSNLALWVHHYARPLGFISGVPPEWRPKFVDGGFVPLTVRHDATESAPVIPTATYLESNLNIAALSEYIRGEANQALQEIGVPLTLAVKDDGSGGGQGMSGLAIAALSADLITYARGRQPLFNDHETHVCALICRVASTEAGNPAEGMAGRLAAVADDCTLRVAWPEISIDLPGDARDKADEWEIDHAILTPLGALMARRGLDLVEAIEEWRALSRQRKMLAAIEADPEAPIDPFMPPDDTAPPVPPKGPGAVAPDMGIPEPAEGTTGPVGAVPTVTATVAFTPNEPIPATLAGIPGWGQGGTES